MKTNHIAIVLLVAVSVFGVRASLMSPVDLNRMHIKFYHDKVQSGNAVSQDVDMYKKSLQEGITFAKAKLEELKRSMWKMRGPDKQIEYQIAKLEQGIQYLESKLSKLEI